MPQYTIILGFQFVKVTHCTFVLFLDTVSRYDGYLELAQTSHSMVWHVVSSFGSNLPRGLHELFSSTANIKFAIIHLIYCEQISAFSLQKEKLEAFDRWLCNTEMPGVG